MKRRNLFLLLLITFIFNSSPIKAASGIEIDASVKTTLNKFYKNSPNSKEFLESAKAVLVFPKVYKAGFLFGGQYGEGSLLINGIKQDYYNLASASFGFQFGAQKKSIIIAFLQDSALQSFLNSDKWKSIFTIINNFYSWSRCFCGSSYSRCWWFYRRG